MLDKFVEKIKQVYGNDLVSIILYGSTVTGEATRKYSDFNLILILNKINFSHLRALEKYIIKWIRKGNSAPIMFTKESLLNSIDVFPIEFSDIKQNHKVLFGEDPFTKMEIDNKNLRHECEYLLKSHLLKLRQEYMANPYDSKRIKNLLVSSLSSILTVFKHTLRLLNIEPPTKKLDALNVLSEKFNIDKSVFITIYEIKNGNKQTSKTNVDILFENYLKEIENVVNLVDNIKQ